MFHEFTPAAVGIENLIKEAKYGVSIHRIATSRFVANKFDLLIKLLA